MKLLFSTCLLCLIFCAEAQNYVAYQRLLNRIDDDLLLENQSAALNSLDTLSAAYDFIYARHAFKALQICCTQNDSVRAEKWLTKCFLQGVPRWMVRTNGLTKKAVEYADCKIVFIKFDSLHQIYVSKINNSVKQHIERLLARDQRITKKVNDGFILRRFLVWQTSWKRNNKREFGEINTIMDQSGYPGERLIGLPDYLDDSVACVKDFVFFGPEMLKDFRTYTMLLHYFSKPRPDISRKLKANVESGFLAPRICADLFDFMAEYGKDRYAKYNHYFSRIKGPAENKGAELNLIRDSIGLQSYEKKLRNDSLSLEYRKHKVGNLRTLLE